MKIVKAGDRTFGLMGTAEKLATIQKNSSHQHVTRISLIEMIPSFRHEKRSIPIEWPGIAITNPSDSFDLRKGLHLAAENAMDHAALEGAEDRKVIHQMVEDFMADQKARGQV